jgi:hypothetical protein
MIRSGEGGVDASYTMTIPRVPPQPTRQPQRLHLQPFGDVVERQVCHRAFGYLDRDFVCGCVVWATNASTDSTSITLVHSVDLGPTFGHWVGPFFLRATRIHLAVSAARGSQGPTVHQ